MALGSFPLIAAAGASVGLVTWLQLRRLLVAYGLVITYSTSYEDVAAGDPAQFILRGAIFTVLGLVVMAAVAYYYLRAEKEGTTATELAKVFE